MRPIIPEELANAVIVGWEDVVEVDEDIPPTLRAEDVARALAELSVRLEDK